jgi:hypothetical protein
MPYSVVTGIASLVSVTTLFCIFIIMWQHPLTRIGSRPPVLVNVSSVEAATEVDNVLTVTAVPPHFITNYDVLALLYVNSTTERVHINETDEILMQRNKIKEVMILFSKS